MAFTYTLNPIHTHDQGFLLHGKNPLHRVLYIIPSSLSQVPLIIAVLGSKPILHQASIDTYYGGRRHMCWLALRDLGVNGGRRAE